MEKTYIEVIDEFRRGARLEELICEYIQSNVIHTSLLQDKLTEIIQREKEQTSMELCYPTRRKMIQQKLDVLERNVRRIQEAFSEFNKYEQERGL